MPFVAFFGYFRNFHFVLTYPQASDSYKPMPRLKKSTAKERALKLAKTLRKTNGDQSKAAKLLGVTRQTINGKTHSPEFQSLRMQAINRAAKQAGLTLARIYGAVNGSLDANVVACYEGEAIESDAADHRARLIGAKIGLELFQHIGGDLKDEMKPTEIHVHYGHRSKPPVKEDDNG